MIMMMMMMMTTVVVMVLLVVALWYITQKEKPIGLSYDFLLRKET